MASVLTYAARAADEMPAIDFSEERFFRFGMEIAAANKVIADDKRWEIAYRVDTPSTNEINCRLDKQVIYLLRFFEGHCYHLEKRADIPPEQVQPIFEFYHKLYGDSPEATQSRGGEIYFSRWSLRNREIELTAYQRQSGNYAVMYQELDKLVEGEALYARDNEISSQPTEVDPITGRPRVTPSDNAGDQPADEPAEGDDNPPPEQKPADKQPDQQPPADKPDDTPNEVVKTGRHQRSAPT
jgi:hypothetical protein